MLFIYCLLKAGITSLIPPRIVVVNFALGTTTCRIKHSSNTTGNGPGFSLGLSVRGLQVVGSRRDKEGLDSKGRMNSPYYW